MLMVHCSHGSDPELIYLTDGASKGVMQILNTIIRGAGDGVLFYFLYWPWERDCFLLQKLILEWISFFILSTLFVCEF